MARPGLRRPQAFLLRGGYWTACWARMAGCPTPIPGREQRRGAGQNAAALPGHCRHLLAVGGIGIIPNIMLMPSPSAPGIRTIRKAIGAERRASSPSSQSSLRDLRHRRPVRIAAGHIGFCTLIVGKLSFKMILWPSQTLPSLLLHFRGPGRHLRPRNTTIRSLRPSR